MSQARTGDTFETFDTDFQRRVMSAQTVEDWSKILQDHLSFGNKKLDDSIAVFNMGAAHDCPNLGTEHCQVADSDCYAVKSENRYKQVLPYRRRQSYLWDALDAETFARAFLRVVDRKRKPVHALRFNVSGDFRVNGDIVRADRVAEILSENGIVTYTYTASDYLDWSAVDHLTVNASNDRNDDANQRFKVVESETDVPDDGFVCPGECGPCKACMFPGGDDVIYEVLR